MHISRIRIVNFANFSNLDVETGHDIVVVGENKVGKSNFILALQLLLDPSLSERDRQLGLEQFWDGLGEKKLGATVDISIELTDFEDDPRLLAHLGDCVVALGPPMVAKLTYRFRPKAELEGEPKSLSDYEYVLFGGADPDNSLNPGLRRMLPVDVLDALRDVEKDLASWRRSPLRPIIERLTGDLDEEDRAEIEKKINTAQEGLASREDVTEAARSITELLEDMIGEKHGTAVSLGLAPIRADALLRGLRVLIDGGVRGVGDASLGTANLIFLALKSLELDQLLEERERDHTFLVVEEPEAHLHPHVQRLVYRYFLEDDEDDDEDEDEDNSDLGVTTILTTHSPHITSVTPLRSIVLLREDAKSGSTVGVSAARVSLTKADEADLQRYIDVSRGEVFFARGVVLVEGDAERFLMPEFAERLDIDLDALGITICSVGGTNFVPYVKLLGAGGLKIPHVVVTDRDPDGDGPPLARRRLEGLLAIADPECDHTQDAERALFRRCEREGYFVNESTLEVDLFKGGLGEAMKNVLVSELSLRRQNRELLDGWINDPSTLNPDRLVGFIERVGKGRFAQRLAPDVNEETCPAYIRKALERIRDVVA